MQGESAMTLKEANLTMLSLIPDNQQEQIFIYLKNNYYKNSPFKPLASDEILSELAESRAFYEKSEYEEFEKALDDISRRYGL